MAAPSDDDTFTIERQAYDSWPAAESEPFGEWMLRFNHGVTNRANSAWACGAPEGDLADAISAVTDWYAARERPPSALTVTQWP